MKRLQRNVGEKHGLPDTKGKLSFSWSVEVLRDPNQSQSTGYNSLRDSENQINLETRKKKLLAKLIGIRFKMNKVKITKKLHTYAHLCMCTYRLSNLTRVLDLFWNVHLSYKFSDTGYYSTHKVLHHSSWYLVTVSKIIITD